LPQYMRRDLEREWADTWTLKNGASALDQVFKTVGASRYLFSACLRAMPLQNAVESFRLVQDIPDSDYESKWGTAKIYDCAIILRRMSPQESLSLLRGMPPSAFSTNYIVNRVRDSVIEDPANAKGLMDAAPGDSRTGNALLSAATSLTAKDPESGAAILNALPGERMRSMGIQRIVGEYLPEGFAARWVESITDPTTKGKAIAELARRGVRIETR
jgi:hypothetical protein